MRFVFLLAFLPVLLTLGYFWLFYGKTPKKPDKIQTNLQLKTNMRIYSKVFSEGEFIPSKYTCDGENTNPPLAIEDVPDEAKSLALIMDDPDVPAQVRPDQHFTHWLLYNISPDTKEIPENSAPATQGLNDAGKIGYIGPCPPTQFEPTTHRYFFKLYALDQELNLPEGLTQKELEEAIKYHVIAKAEFYGVYDRAK